MNKPTDQRSHLRRTADAELERAVRAIKENELRRSAAIFRELFEHMGSAVAVYKAVDDGNDFIIHDFNRAAEKAENIRREQIIGRRVTDVFPGVRDFGLFEVFQRVWRTGHPEHLPATFYQDERISGWRENYVYCLPTGEVVAIYEDVTERKRLELAIQESEARYRALFEQAADPIWLVDPDTGTFADFNTTAHESLGYTREEFSQLGIADIDALETAEDVARHIRKIMNEGSDTYETVHRTKHGENRNILARAVSLGYGRRKLIQVILHDITLRKQAEEKLLLASMVYECSNEAMMVTDEANNIIAVNPAFEKLTGYTADEVRGKNPRIFNSGLQDDAFYQAMWHDLNTVGFWQGELFDKRKNGEIYPKLMTINTIKNSRGRIDRHVAVFYDITEKKENEERIWRQANFDPLTELPNRRLLRDRLEHAMASSKRSNLYCALMFLDLDNFKPLNDEYGHEAGDVLLVEAARRISNCVREADTVGRLGGDEFIVLLGEIDEDKSASAAEAGIVADKIRAALEEPYFIEIRHKGNASMTVEHHCTASIGVALFINHENEADEVIKWADMAMYQAKEAGRNQIRFYEAPS